MGTEVEGYTNKHHWPIEVCNAILKDRYQHEDDLPSDFSTTTLIAPIQQTILKKRHKDNLKKGDVSDLFWAFLGSISHAVIEENHVAAEGKKVEERLYATVGDKVISGKLDCYHDGEIKDYKSTKAYKIIKGDYSDWEAQLNIYAYLLRTNGHVVKRLSIIAIIFDWKEHESYKEGYPKSAIVTLPMRLWSLEEQETYIRGRVAALKAADSLVDSLLPPCTDRECWDEIVSHAAIKYGASKATKLFNSEEEALQFIRDKGNNMLYYQIRKTGPKRCTRFCSASIHCNQYKKYLAEKGLSDEEDRFD